MQTYNDPAHGKPSSSGAQMRTHFLVAKVLMDEEENFLFSQLGSPLKLPRNNGKEILREVDIPLLDDRNVNDQGIDARGNRIKNGNLYASSRDIGMVQQNMPVITEIGGRVNRVGMTNAVISATIQNFGFFTEYSKDTVDFSSNASWEMWAHGKVIKTAVQLQEDQVQVDLLRGAGNVRYGGIALSDDEMDETSRVEYEDFARLSVDLDRANTPKNTKIIKGSTNTDTVTVAAARVMYIGHDVIQDLRKLKDYHGEKAFVGVEHYAAGGEILHGEIGKIDQFRLVVVPKMLVFRGKGAAVGADKNLHTTDGKADIFPMLVVGSEAFSLINFNPEGETAKFHVIHKKPGDATASKLDPYGKTGFISVQWWYGMMIERPERIALLKTTALL